MNTKHVRLFVIAFAVVCVFNASLHKQPPPLSVKLVPSCHVVVVVVVVGTDQSYVYLHASVWY